MRIRFLGTAAGGGFPQWNCNCRLCDGVRFNKIRAIPRTQSSLVVSSDGQQWLLVNASPDIREQLRANPDLQPARKIRDSGIVGALLTDGQLDHTAGLLLLREATSPLKVWCTESVYEDLQNGYPVFGILKHYGGAERQPIPMGRRSFAIDELPGIRFEAFPSSSKPPPFSPHREMPRADDNIALRMVDIHTGRSVFFGPGLGKFSETIWQSMYASDCVVVDGTFWTDDEMIQMKLSKNTSQELGHLPLTGMDCMIDRLGRLPRATRKIVTHINNTNPILDEHSPERALLDRLGIEAAYDGLEIVL